MIKLQVIGNLGADAVSNNVNGRNVINFSVAHSEKYKDAQGQEQTRTVWVNCAYWTEKLGILPYLLKGKTVYVEGTPSLETYTTQDGKTNPKLKLNIREISLVGGSGGNNNQASTQQQEGSQQDTSSMPGKTIESDPSILDNDLPF
jgi:single-strand DNA-binding protein